MELFNNWVKDNNLNLEFITEDIFKIVNEESLYILIKAKELPFSKSKEQVIFNKDFELNILEEELNIIEENKIDYIVFNFGGNFYYTKKDDIKQPDLNLFKYIGQSTVKDNCNFYHLGIHGKFELSNGVGEYVDYAKKAKFLNHKALGICEYNTLAGIISLQIACEKYKIKPIFGETINLCIPKKEGYSEFFRVKLYVKNEIGWINLLKIHKEIKIHNDGFCKIDDFFTKTEGLVCVLPNDFDFKNKKLHKSFLDNFETDLFFQIDTVEWENDDNDIKYLENIKYYLENLDYININPILINDSYYIDKNFYDIKKNLNSIAKINEKDSKNQYYKSFSESEQILNALFKEKQEFLIALLEECKGSLDYIYEYCNFKMKIGDFHLPKFNMSHLNLDEDMDNISFLLTLLDKAIEDKGLDSDKYIERLEKELDVIIEGGFVDYFLILWDVIRWCKENKILTGIGRGSAAGSLVAYLLDITRIDPLEYDLLFERFLNEGRIGKSLPDIDLDFEGLKREEVKQYLENRYGKSYVCSIGSYNLNKIVSSIKDLSRLKGIDFNKVNIMTSIMTLPEGKNGNFNQVFLSALKLPILRDFIDTNPKLINDLGSMLNIPKSEKVHPCATVVLPDYGDGDMFTKIPIRKDPKTGILVSEWEGEHLEKLGYLKEDILGLKELDKFRFIIDLIKETTGKEIDIYSIPTDDSNVFRYFKNGWNNDVFQFGTSALTAFCKQVQPDSLEELITIVSIFRPGPMHSGVHHKYINIKFGKENPEYDYGCEEATKTTFGLLVFQEQMMRICQNLAGFTLREADDIRKACGKKIESLIKGYKKQFVEAAIKNGCPKDEAYIIWDKIQAFSSYAFNKSHAASYAMTGYISQYFKVNYPLQFWTTAFQFETNKQTIVKYMSEIKRTNKLIKIVPPDINKSDRNFKSDSKTGYIYWNLQSILGLGDIALEAILKERELNAPFYSLKEFLNRIPKSKVDKGCISSLILSGSFDEIYGIKDIRQRKNIIEEFYNERNVSLTNKKDWVVDFIYDDNSKNDWWWILMQKELSSIGYLDYKQLFRENEILKTNASQLIEAIDLQNEDYINKFASMGGLVLSIEWKTSKNGEWALVKLDNNDEEVSVSIWNNEVRKYEKELKNLKKKDVFLFTGIVREFRGINSFHFTQQSKLVIYEYGQ